MEKRRLYIGQRLVFNMDMELTTILGEKTEFKKGTQVFVGADNHFHFLNNDRLNITDHENVDGFDVDGIARWIIHYLREDDNVSFEEFCEELADEKNTSPSEIRRSFANVIKKALSDLGFEKDGEVVHCKENS